KDEIWTEAACRIIRGRMPRLLALHLNNVDSAHHRYGPGSAPGYTAVALNDANVGRVLRALDDPKGRDRAAVFIVADHGFIATPTARRPTAALRRGGLPPAKAGGVFSGGALAAPGGETAMVFPTAPATASRDREAVIRLFQGAERIAAIIEP